MDIKSKVLIGVVVLAAGLFLYFLTSKAVQYFWHKYPVNLENQKNLKTISAQYDEPFTPELNVALAFPDFTLVYMGVVPLSEEEKKEKAEAIKNNIDGGYSMLTDSLIFHVYQTDGSFLQKVQFRKLPYAWGDIEANSKNFLIKYEGKKLIVEQGSN